MRVLIACPVKDRAWILTHYLQTILELDYPKPLISLFWIVNNSKDESLQILKKFKEIYGHLYENVIIEVHVNTTIVDDLRSKQIRRGQTYHWLAFLRNKILDKCVDLDCDYLFSSDSDILLKKDTLQRLLAHGEDCVSSLVYNGYLHTPKGAPRGYSPIENAHMFTNCLIFDADKCMYVHIRNKRTRLPNLNEVGTTIVTHFTGACILISKVLCKQSRYAYFRTGEDEPFCRKARELSYNVLCDVSMFNAHIMSPSLLQLYLDGLMPKVY